MKKLFILMLALCLLCVSAAALAETGATEATKLELDGFTLELTHGELYTTNEKAANQVYIMVYPLYASGDTATNYSFTWVGGTFNKTVEDIQVEAVALEESVRAGLEVQGITMDSFAVEDIYETTVNDAKCIILDYELKMSAAGQSFTVSGRQLMFGSIGYTATITTLTPESREEITNQMVQSLSF